MVEQERSNSLTSLGQYNSAMAPSRASAGNPGFKNAMAWRKHGPGTTLLQSRPSVGIRSDLWVAWQSKDDHQMPCADNSAMNSSGCITTISSLAFS